MATGTRRPIRAAYDALQERRPACMISGEDAMAVSIGPGESRRFAPVMAPTFGGMR